MFAKLKLQKLPDAKNFTIKTNLTKEIASARLKKLTTRLYPVFDLSSDTPKFVGKITPQAFELTLVKDNIETWPPLFSPPSIKGTWLGGDTVDLQISIGFTKSHNFMLKFFSGFIWVFIIFAALIPATGIILETYQDLQVSESMPNLSIALGEYFKIAHIHFFLLLLTLLVLRLVFLFFPRALMVRSMPRAINSIHSVFRSDF